MSTKLNFLNLGCGNKFHESWINVDMVPADSRVIQCNFLNGIPFDENRFEVVYHSHVLEHFSKNDGEIFIKECYRILKPGGIIRIVLPNLERIAKEYLINLERAEGNEPGAEKDYDWILLEMYDQTVRNYSGGEMVDYLQNKNKINFDYVDSRIGWSEYLRVSEAFQKEEKTGVEKITLFNQSVKSKLQNIKYRILLSLLSESDKVAIDIGRFRLGGEIHQWMYDKYSLRRLLSHLGFQSILIRTANESYINNWASFHLDNPNETASLFIEGIK